MPTTTVSPSSNIPDMERCRKIAAILFKDYSEKVGVFKQFRFPPEYLLPEGMRKSSEEHLLFITLTVSLDYMRDAEKLWKQSRDAWLDLNRRWIFDSKIVVSKGPDALVSVFKLIHDQRPNKDAKIWFTICKKLLELGGVLNLLKRLDFDAMKIDKYLDDNKQSFPYLGGYKIKPLWLRMLNDTASIRLKGMEQIPIPIDVHTARMSLKLVFDEKFDGKINGELRTRIQNIWKTIVAGTDIYPIQLDEPLWLLGKYGLLDAFLKEHNL